MNEQAYKLVARMVVAGMAKQLYVSIRERMKAKGG